MIDQNDMNQIIKQMKDIFVTRDECSENNAEVRRLINSVSLDLVAIKLQLKIITWIAATSGAAAIGMAIKYLFGIA